MDGTGLAVDASGGLLLEIVEIDEDLSWAGAVLGSDDALVLHEIHESGGAIVADAQPSLDHGRRGAPGGTEHVERLAVQFLVVS
jgi:hypothetical protein